MTPRRVSMFLPSLAGGGAERAVSTVAAGLAARGVPTTLVLGQAIGPFMSELSPLVRVIDLHSPSPTGALFGLARHLRRDRPQVLFAAMNHANVVAALAHRLARSRARLVLSERTTLSALLDADRSLRMRITAALTRLTYPWADRVVAVSEGVAQDLYRLLPLEPGRVLTVYNPVVDGSVSERAASAPNHPWLAHPEVPVVLAAGRLIAAKDFGTLIDAFALVRRGRRLRLLILGEGEQRVPLLTQAARLGVAEDVALPGFDPNPFAAMSAASLFVLSSRFEGLPGVLIQAMACGARVVSTDCPSGPREVLEGGRWGRLVAVGDAPALAAAMAAALDEPNPPDARTRAAAFSVERALDGYAEALGLS